MAKIFKIALIFLFFGALPVAVNAATLYFAPSSGSYTVGSTLSASVYVSSQDQAMNATSSVILFPADKLQVLSFSKTGSIISLWVQEPSFSNSAGTANFEGIVLNPGFTGSAGKVIAINFRVKGEGSASLTFSSGSVLANDGRGTNILTSLGNASFALGGTTLSVPETKTPTEVIGSLGTPQISSPTHPDSEKWYSNNNPEFIWQLPSDVTGVSLLLHKKPTADPGPISDGLIESKKFENVEDGIWYFHIKFRSKQGWGQIIHHKIQIDTKLPLPFEIKVKEGNETTNPQPTIIFETTDEISGIDYYEVKIDQQEPIKTGEKEYKIPAQPVGKHTIIVKAVDKAGNYILAVSEINILPLGAPIITDYPETLLPGTFISIKGKAIPEATIKVYFQKDEKRVEMGETKSDKDGKWSFVGTDPLKRGVYKIWVEAIDFLGAKSKPSEKISIQVIPSVFMRIGRLVIDYPTTTIILFVFILIMASGIIWNWWKIKQAKKRLKKEVTEAEKTLYQAFKAFQKETEKQIAELDGQPDLSERERKVCDSLKEALKISEKIIRKTMKDIEKELE